MSDLPEWIDVEEMPTWLLCCAECHGGGAEKTIGLFRRQLVDACEWCGRAIEAGSGRCTQSRDLVRRIHERIWETEREVVG